jgi:hypothetical protein
MDNFHTFESGLIEGSMKKNLSRRSFLIKASQGVAGITAFSAYSRTFASSPVKRVNCEFGVEGSAPHEAKALDEFLKATRELGADFIVCQFSPKNYNPAARKKDSGWLWEGTKENFNELSLACRKYNMSFFANQEVTNYTKEGDVLDEKGNDILAHPDKTHRWDISGQLLKEATSNKEFRGVLYDEPEHGQMRREANTNGGSDGESAKGIHPYFAATDEMTVAMKDHMPDFKRVMDESGQGGMDMLCQRFAGFHHYAKIFENVAAGIEPG